MAVADRMTLLRQEFEQWARQQGLWLSRLFNDRRYESMETEWAWRAFAFARGVAEARYQTERAQPPTGRLCPPCNHNCNEGDDCPARA
jgi:hypothetical protein